MLIIYVMIETKNISIKQLEVNKGQIEGLPKNPRFIRDERYEALKKSISDAPEMLSLRELIVYPFNGKYVICGGNMRFRACKDLGHKEIPCKILDADTPVEKLREYTIKDNNGFGQDDFDLLANEWDVNELTDWGMELPDFDVDDVKTEEKPLKDLSDNITTSFRLEITLENESEQEALYNKLIGEGYACRILTF